MNQTNKDIENLIPFASEIAYKIQSMARTKVFPKRKENGWTLDYTEICMVVDRLINTYDELLISAEEVEAVTLALGDLGYVSIEMEKE